MTCGALREQLKAKVKKHVASENWEKVPDLMACTMNLESSCPSRGDDLSTEPHTGRLLNIKEIEERRKRRQERWKELTTKGKSLLQSN